MKPNFTLLKICTGRVDVNQWSKLTKTEQKDALSKSWYVYFSFCDPNTGMLKRQPNINRGVDKFSSKKQQLSFLKIIQANLYLLLKEGFSPFQRNIELERGCTWAG